MLFQCPIQKRKKTRKTGFSAFPSSSTGKESTCNEGVPSLIPGTGRSPGEGIGYPKLQYSWASLVAQTVNNLPKVEDLCLIPGLGRSPGEEDGNTLQYTCLENPHGQRNLGLQRVRYD